MFFTILYVSHDFFFYKSLNQNSETHFPASECLLPLETKMVDELWIVNKKSFFKIHLIISF